MTAFLFVKDLVTLVEKVKPTCVVGAVGVAPNCASNRLVILFVAFSTLVP